MFQTFLTNMSSGDKMALGIVLGITLPLGLATVVNLLVESPPDIAITCSSGLVVTIDNLQNYDIDDRMLVTQLLLEDCTHE